MRYIFGGLLVLAVVATSCSSSSDAEVATAEGASAQASAATQEPVAATEPEPAEQVNQAEASPAEDIPAEDRAEEESAADNDGLFPTIVDATASTSDGTTWRFDVTLLSEYDSPERYADAWRVLDENDVELGIRVLGHDHANEQPFTRSTTVDIPMEATTVFIEARDQLNGWNNERFAVTLDR